MRTATVAAMLILAALPSSVFADTGYRNIVTFDVAGAPEIDLNGLNGDVR
ncbi:MAG: hypothetical protein JO165_04030, partial [Candidatus Eremiobacteraeota bacterium]|nr:hypothetical protein [Candidatus Eremiobacteraeota bacterium]